MEPPTGRARPAPAHAVGAAAAVVVALAALPGPADAARLPLSDGVLLAWAEPADPAPGPATPAATCRTSDPDLPCTVEVTVRTQWDDGYDIDVVVRDARTGGSTAAVPWTVTLDLAQAPFPWVPTSVAASGVVAETSCDDLPVLRVSGTTGWGDHHLLGPRR